MRARWERENIDEARWMMDRSFWVVSFKVEKKSCSPNIVLFYTKSADFL